MTRKGKTLLLVVLAPIMLLPLALMGAFVAMIGVTVLLGAAGAMMGIFSNSANATESGNSLDTNTSGTENSRWFGDSGAHGSTESAGSSDTGSSDSGSSSGGDSGGGGGSD